MQKFHFLNYGLSYVPISFDIKLRINQTAIILSFMIITQRETKVFVQVVYCRRKKKNIFFISQIYVRNCYMCVDDYESSLKVKNRNKMSISPIFRCIYCNNLKPSLQSNKN